jgi:hypothetical protein
MLSVNLSTKNTRNNTVPNPIPFDDVLFAIILLILMLLLLLLLARCIMLDVTSRV